MVEQAAAAAETMRVQAAQLTDVVGTFRVRADDKVAGVASRGLAALPA
jgi:hypothetical protein